MSEQKDKLFCGNAKTITTQYGDLTKVSMSSSDLNTIVGYMKENKSEWVNMNIKEKKEKVEGKPTHYLEIDTWKPEGKAVQQPAQTVESDLPF